MKELYLITGPCGVGKTTISAEISKKINKSCVINGDTIYHMINTNKTPKKDFETGSNLLKLVFKNSIDLINNFLENDMNVIYEYIIFPKDLKYILENIKDIKNVKIKFILLLADEEIIVQRNINRKKNNSKRGIELIKIFKDYKFDSKFILENKNYNINETCNEILENDRFII